MPFPMAPNGKPLSEMTLKTLAKGAAYVSAKSSLSLNVLDPVLYGKAACAGTPSHSRKHRSNYRRAWNCLLQHMAWQIT